MGLNMENHLINRLERLRTALDQAHLKGLILNNSGYIFHLTSWVPPQWAQVFVVISLDEFILITPFIPEDIQPTWTNAITYDSFSLNELINVKSNVIYAFQQAMDQAELSEKTIGVVTDTFLGHYLQELKKLVQIQDVTHLLQTETAIKDEFAQRAIRQRVEYLDQAFELVAAIAQPGMSEIELFGEIYKLLAKLQGSPINLECNMASGLRTIKSEPQPTKKILETKDLLLIDLFPMLGGYGADYTRNYVLSEANDDQIKQHKVLEKALLAAEAILHPDIAASDIDRIVRKVIEDEGYGMYAHQHHSGHAFGLAIPESPWLIPADHARLKAGMVIAVEPGIYHPINGGMRLEGDYIITTDGCESLSGFPPLLTVCK
jgi:Xaa-Pro dipeptidase